MESIKMTPMLNGVVFFFFLANFMKVQAEDFHGRHVCNQQQTVTQSVPVQQSYRRAVYKKDLQSVTYQTAFRTVIKMQIHAELVSGCCPGWDKRSPRDVNCLKPVCNEDCQNKGQCVGPGLCVCAEGYTGYKCHIDIDECSGRNTCQQKCTNLPGSYECACQEGFKLASDESTCDLCLNCTRDFQSLETQIKTIQDNSIKNETVQKIIKQIDNLAKVKTQAESINKVQKQIDILRNTTFHDDRYQKLHTKVNSLQNKLNEVDLIKPLREKIAKLEKTSVQEGRLIQIRSQIENLQEMKATIDSLRASNDEIKRVQGDDTKERKITKLQEQIEGFIITKDEQDRKLAGRLEEMRIELEYVSEMREQMETMREMKSQLGQMTKRIIELETDKADLKSNLTSVMTQYETAMSSFQSKHVDTRDLTTSDPEDMDINMPMDRLASLSAQISILEEKMAECSCNQDYPRGYGRYGK